MPGYSATGLVYSANGTVTASTGESQVVFGKKYRRAAGYSRGSTSPAGAGSLQSKVSSSPVTSTSEYAE